MKVLTAFLLVLCSVMAFAQHTGMDLKKYCARTEPTSTFVATQASVQAYGNTEYCYGYIYGYFSFGLHSVPNGVTVEQFRLVLVRYMNNHPQDLHLYASEIIVQAANDAWKK